MEPDSAHSSPSHGFRCAHSPADAALNSPMKSPSKYEIGEFKSATK